MPVSEVMTLSESQVLKNYVSVSESESEVKNSPGSESVSTFELMSLPISLSVYEPSSESWIQKEKILKIPDESGPKWTVHRGESKRSFKWTVHPKVDGLEPNWTVI